MKRVDAVIRPSQLDEVKQRLTGLGVTGLTAFEVRGFGRQKGHTETYRGSEYTVDFVPKIYLSIIVAEDLVNATAEVLDWQAPKLLATFPGATIAAVRERFAASAAESEEVPEQEADAEEVNPDEEGS